MSLVRLASRGLGAALGLAAAFACHDAAPADLVFRNGVVYTVDAARSWARTVAANVVRRARVRSRGWSLTALPEGLDEPADVRGGPSALLAGEEQRRSLAGALVLLLLHYAAAYERLVPRDRRALQMVEVERRGYAEAGALLHVGRSNMKMIVFRARKRIRSHMQRAMGADARPTRRAAG